MPGAQDLRPCISIAFASDGGRSRVGRAHACACARWLAGRGTTRRRALSVGGRARYVPASRDPPPPPSATSWRSLVERRKTPLPPVFFFPRPQSFPPKKAVPNPAEPGSVARAFPAAHPGGSSTLHHRWGRRVGATATPAGPGPLSFI